MAIPSAKTIQVKWRNSTKNISVVKDFDGFLDEFAVEVDGRLDDERCPFGVLLWPSSRTLAERLDQNPPSLAPKTIIELGCGVGYLACALATIYPEAQVIACDYETYLEPFVLANAREFGVQERVRFQAIDWRKEPPTELLESADLVLGADVFYDDSHLIHLPPFAAKIMHPKAQLILANPRRFRYGKALEDLAQHFAILEHVEVNCALDQEGIEEFMIGSGYREQKISVLTLTPLKP